MNSTRKQDAALLGLLFSRRGEFLSRQELASAGGVPASALEARLTPYVEAGYPIEFHPQGGVVLHDPPDIWCGEEILGRCPLPGRRPKWEPLLLAETASTNDVAREQGRKGARDGFVVAAARQTAGRGRLGRNWESRAGCGLYVSILLRPELALGESGRLAVIGSLAAADGIENVAGVRPKIKWPNDLIVKDRKLGGLLIETERKGAGLVFAVVGIGINVRHKQEDFSPEVAGLATSVYLATGQLVRRADLLVALLQALERRLEQPFGEAREAWTSSSLTLGQQVMLTTLRGRRHGQAIGMDESGALLLRGDSGEIEAVTAGDMQAC